MGFLKLNINDYITDPKLDIAYVTVSDPVTSGKLAGKHDASLSILDSIFSNLLLAVQRDRRSLERRMTRRMQLPGHFEYAIPKKNIVPCLECGHFHEKGSICGKKNVLLKRVFCKILLIFVLKYR